LSNFEKDINDIEDFEDYEKYLGIPDDDEYDEDGNIKELEF